MDVTKPCEFIRFGAMDVTKPYEFIGFGAMAVTKPYEFIGFGAMDVTKPYDPDPATPNPLENPGWPASGEGGWGRREPGGGSTPKDLVLVHLFRT